MFFIRRWISAAKESDFVVDVGGHFGFFTLLAPSKRNVIFESDSRFVKAIEENLEKNHIEAKIEVKRVGEDAALDSYFKSSCPDLIKIDVQGEELYI